MSVQHYSVDIIIVGGGIAGLWALHRFRQLGFHAVLIEEKALGFGQTIASQGIIHGGAKYALRGKVSQASLTVADMPNFWRRCLRGEGEVDLTGVTVTSPYHYLFSNGKVASSLSHFLAGHALRNSEAISRQDFPELLQHAAFRGHVYRLNEVVLDVPSLLEQLAKLNAEALLHASILMDQVALDTMDRLRELPLQLADGTYLRLSAGWFIFTAGAGNQSLLQKLQWAPIMQRRPLHMVLTKFQQPYRLFAHAIGNLPKPRLTITTHRAVNGATVWYLGGELAEESGVARDEASQIHYAQHELKALLPWVDLHQAQWATYRIDRAELYQATGSRPNQATVQQQGNCLFAWPTKLALAPQLAEQLITLVQQQPWQQQEPAKALPIDFPKPAIARPIWEDIF